MNQSGPTITFIGAGSVTFTRMLVGDILSYPELAGAALRLHDIDTERLEVAAALARMTADEAGASPQITTHADRGSALDGADFVLNMVQVGGHRATVIDHQIPARYGIRQTIGDTLGIGGIFRALRTIPLIRALASEIGERCPDAWLLNYTNPMAMLVWAACEANPSLRVAGLCHSIPNTTRQLAQITETPFDEVRFVGAGVNHQAFILRFERDGESLYPRLDAAIARDPQLRRRARVQMYLRLGYFPTESSEHGAEYVPWFMRHDEEIERLRLIESEYVQMSEENLEEYEHAKRAVANGRALAIEPSIEYAPQIVHSICTGTPRIVYASVRNGGVIPNLPSPAAVEVPCAVDGTGLRACHVGELPPQLAALNRTFLNVAELTVRAGLDGRPEYVRHAAMLDPNTAATLTLEQIDGLVAELTDAHGELLPAPLRRGRERAGAVA